MAEGKKRLLTGLKPTGPLHIGNYFGSLKLFADMYEDYDSMIMIADYHALTTLSNPSEVKENIINLARDYIAAGINPSKAIIFKQSDILEHTELAWIFECLVSVPFLMQAHAFKDAQAKGKETNAGVFNYPMLMAADILLYDTEIVPVGQDQRQHVEYSREAASKFNNAYGETFKEPKELILPDIGTLIGTDGRKMSKSYKNTIPLFGTDEEIRNAVMSVTTDSTPVGSPLNTEADILFSLHRHFTPNLPELDKRYKEGSIGYKESKEMLAANIIATIAPMRARKEALSKEAVLQILKDGAEVAKALAEAKMKDVREKIGVSVY